MKPTQTRRFRRRSTPSRSEGAFFKKESQHEQGFFGESSHDSFFQPAVSPVQSIQRKCDECEKEEKKVHRMGDKKEEEKKLHRMPEKKEEDKKLMRQEDKKEEEIQKKEEKKEDEKLMKKEEKKEEDKLQKKEATTAAASSAGVSNYVSTISSKGNPLPAQTNSFFSSRMGYDFSNVKVHTDKNAADSAKGINAKAYTIGNDIVFNEGQFNAESGEGRKLLAHELAHVIQQNGNEKGDSLQRQSEETNSEEKVLLPPVQIHVVGSLTQNTRHNADCNGVSVSGSTDAFYSNSSSLSGTPTLAATCDGCTGNECISISGNIVSVFRTAPVVTLPGVPSGLNTCEQNAVRNFINTTLSQHEQQHVAAFNTYRGTVSTPFTFTGCRSDLQAQVQAAHDAIEVPRRAASDALSAALDANGANVFTITCDCPDPQTSNDVDTN
jgi:hypothetical protein